MYNEADHAVPVVGHLAVKCAPLSRPLQWFEAGIATNLRYQVIDSRQTQARTYRDGSF